MAVKRVPDSRTAAEHDCDRILYSDELRRLGGVTQTVAVGETPLFHTRLTHTLKVQQLARRIAERFERDARPAEQRKLRAIGGVDVSAAESAGLAHDLGHPPFGHNGESVLNECCKHHGLDGFEGNAQTFRILTKLATHPGVPDGGGLGISNATLKGVIKYPWLRLDKDPDFPKWNAYPTEETVLNDVRSGLDPGERSLEAEIMDWADDVTYAMHDLEDFVRAGYVPMHALVANPDELNRFIDASWARVSKKIPGQTKEQVASNFQTMLEFTFGSIYAQRDWRYSRALIKGCGMLIANYVRSVSLGKRPTPLLVPPTIRGEVELFKQLTWYYVIFDPRLASLQEGQKKLVKALFKSLYKWLEKADNDHVLERLPPRLRWTYELTGLEKDRRAYPSTGARYARAVADYIASLTESQASDLYNRVAAPSGRSVLDPWLLY
jgi:dGTPase